MADRFLTAEVQQIGIESSPGSAAVPTIQFNGLSVDIDTSIEFDEFKVAGNIIPTIVAPRREWSEGSLSGFPTYTEMAYVLSNLFGAATVTTPSGATTTRRWTWTPDKSLPWTPKTWTLRRGDSNTAEEANYLLLSGLGLVFSRVDAVEVSGDLFAQRLNYAASLVAASGVTSRANVPILPGEVNVYLDTSGATLGNTQLTRDFRYELDFSGFFSNMWPLNTSLASYAAHTIQAPDLQTKLQLGNDTVGRGLVTNMRAGSSVFVRCIATSGSQIETGGGGFNYKLTIDSALKVMDAPSRGDHEGASILEWSFRNVYDATWARWLNIVLDVDFATL